MLTKKNPDGTWSIKGIDLDNCTREMYGALLKLHDYEKTGLNPIDFMGDEYEEMYLYKVHYGSYGSSEIKWIYCETRKDAEEIAELLRKAGYDTGVNQWSWQTFIEK